MLKIIAAGRLGKDAVHRTTQNQTDICNFSVAADVGWGDNKRTMWIDVSKFGKGAEGLSRILKKGDAVTVIGEMTTREHDGKTYLQCNADDVTLQGGQSSGDNRGGQSNGNQQDASQGGAWGDDEPKF
tara:strand:- start:20 stop:403 length:384 start_codon:yes stop_codon:yes gene_type:complete